MTVKELIDKLESKCKENNYNTDEIDVIVIDNETNIYTDINVKYDDGGRNELSAIVLEI